MLMDEQKANDRFVRMVGGRARAERLQHIWDTSWPHGCGLTKQPKEVEFKRRAKEEGFTDKQIEVFLSLP
jgi:hypothetical protein